MHTSMHDQMGHLVEFDRVPLRIVSLVPSQTELLCDLGLERNIVGVTKFCVHPYYIKSVSAVVGGTKKVHLDKIAALAPDIIICNKEENTPEMVDALRAIGPVWVTDVRSLPDNAQMISDFGQLFNKRTEAKKWNDKIASAHSAFVQYMHGRPHRKTAYFIWKEPWMVAGSDTFIDQMLALNHFDNIYAGQGRYPEIELRKIRLAGDPELVLLSSEPYPFREQDAFEIGRFTHHAKTVFVNGEMFSWYGSRLHKAFGYFRQLHERIG